MKNRMTSRRRLLWSAAPASLLAAGCVHESGIAERHIQGMVTLPPIAVAEIETGFVQANDTVDTAEAAGLIAFHTVLIDGVVETGPSPEDGETIGELDVYELEAGIPGDITIELKSQDGGAQLAGLTVSDLDGVVLSDPTNNVATGIEWPTFSMALAEEQKIYLQISADDHLEQASYPYRIVVTHGEPADDEDPNAANSLNFRPDPILVGAYLGEEAGRLGNPVSGTSVEGWTYDEAAYTWWSTFDMWAVQQVVSAANVIIEGMDDSLDNNCDGSIDGGNIRSNTGRFDDADADGATEVDGDCDDTDPAIRPGFADTWGDRIDNDCDGWADNGPDGTDHDGDGQSVFDGDCNDADPAILTVAGGEADICNGIDDDCSGATDLSGQGAEGPCIEGLLNENTRDSQDVDGDGYTPDEGDCNDASADIYPDPEASGEVPGQAHVYDFQNFVDDDCDGEVDENYEYTDREGTPNDAYLSEDQDGDGYTMALGDCDDTRESITPGNYETENEYYVNANIDRVYVYAGTFTDLNTTNTAPGDVVTSEPVEVDLNHVNDAVDWNLAESWELGTGGQLVPQGLLTIPLDRFVPVNYCNRVEETPEQDAANNPPYGEVPPGNSIDLGTTCGDGGVLRADAEFTTVVQDTWDGDTDSFRLVTGQDGYLTVYMSWADTAADYDVLLYCYFGNEFNPYDYYEMTGSAGATDNSSNPGYEVATSVVEMGAGTECWIWTAGYAGDPGPYSVKAYH